MATTSGATPLYCAAQSGQASCVKTLLEASAKTSKALNKPCVAPLMVASRYGHLAVVDLLLRAGACVDTKNKFGRSALDHAIRYDRAPCAKLLAAEAAAPHCARCGATRTAKGARLCSGCGRCRGPARYCSEACFLHDWVASHQFECRPCADEA